MAAAVILTPFGWLAAPLMKMLFDKAIVYLGTGMDERKEKLEATVFPSLSLAIEKAEKSPNKEKLVDWLNRLKGAYYQAEEAIDLFEYELLKQKVKKERGTRISSSSQFVPRCFKITLIKLKNDLSVFSRQKIMLKGRIDKLIEIAKEAKAFEDLLGGQENSDAHRETISEPPAKVFGRDNDRKKVVRLLKKNPLNSEPGPSNRPAIPIICITGRSGVGKTTLAQYVYKHMGGQTHFGLHVWVRAPRGFKAPDVIKNIIETINPKERPRNDNPSTSLEALLTQIRRMLVSKKLLLVLDDFWSDTDDFVEQWENFICCLSSCSPGSKILLTTQSKNTAQQVDLAGVTEVETYNLEEIKEDKFLKLFMHHAWPDNSHFDKEQFEEAGQKIAVKLKGDPGAAKLVGHQLRGKPDLSHWADVAEKDWLGDKMKARIWSYQQLPPDLQRCFAICSLFPKGFRFTKQFLIDLWMAEGYIRPTDELEIVEDVGESHLNELEDIGESHLNELVSRFFLEEFDVENIKNYQLHDLFHDLAKRVRGNDFVRINSTDSREIPSSIRIEDIRHIYMPSSMINELKEKLCLMKSIRTFYVEPDGGSVPKKVLEVVLKNFKKLRVLYVPLCVDLPDFIGNLKHLRFLSLYGSEPLEKVPDSICKLYHLQTIVLNCESLPMNFSDLISLRRFYIGEETMSHISHVGRLTSLQGLELFVVRTEHGNELHQLEKMNQIRGAMCITGLENVESTVDARKAHMRNKKHLKTLRFEWNHGHEGDTDNGTGLSTQHVQLLDALQPHLNISVLKIIGFGGERFPNWLLTQNSLKYLTKLALVNCDKLEEISTIGKSLPNCKDLILQGLNNLKKMPSLPSKLTHLVIDYIPQLSYFSEDDLLMKEERKQSKLVVVNQIAEYLKLKYIRVPTDFDSTVMVIIKFVRERLEAAPEICIRRLQYENILSGTVNSDHNANNDENSWDQILDVWVMFMHWHIETLIFNENEDSKLVLPSSITHLKISLFSITNDALSTCIQCLVFLSKLELSYIQTITSLPPKEVLCSLKNLQTITIKGCYLLSSLGGIGALTSLKALELYSCLHLNTSNEPLPSSLKRLIFHDCSNVDVILAKSDLPELCTLEVWNVTITNRRGVLRVGHLSCLEELTIVRFDGGLEGLNSLQLFSLWVMECPEISSSSARMDKYASQLPMVSVDNLSLLKLILSNETISSIENLVIYFSQKGFTNNEVFQSLTSLKDLSIFDCTNTHLPKNLKNLASLRYMSLDNCPNLCEILEEQPRNLHELQIKDCPSLTEKFNRVGPYWVRIHEGSTIVTFPTEVSLAE